ncbi:hypothetical protein R1flu_023192 [Riccia fluitans]|uniref:Uncharacterized protein n=1 Tax=Riccia fluitans TaxID=41844 RepID=A0ABD1XRU6_9MARC
MEIVEPPPWILSLHSLLTDLRALSENSTSTTPRIYRVPPDIREGKANCYDFVVVPLGLYNTDFRAKTPIVELKLEVVSVFLNHLRIDWNAFCSRIANLEKLESPPASPPSRLSEYFNATDMAPDEEREVDTRVAADHSSVADMAPDEEREVDPGAEAGDTSATGMTPNRELDTRAAEDHTIEIALASPDEEREVDPGAEAGDTSATGMTPNRELDTRAAEDHTSEIALASAEDRGTSSTVQGREDRIRSFYHNAPIDFLTSEEVRAALVMDAVFVAAVFLQAYAQPEKYLLTDALRKIFSRGTVQYQVAAFKRDIFLPFENQIPLYMVEIAWKEIYTLVGEKPFDLSLELNIFKFLRDSGLPFPESEEGIMTFHGCDHLLACLYKVICTHVPPTTSKSFISWLLSPLCSVRCFLSGKIYAVSVHLSFISLLLSPFCSVRCFLPGKAIYAFSVRLRNTPIVRHLVKSTKLIKSFCDIVRQQLKFAKSQPGASVHNPSLRRRTLPTVAELRKAGVHFKGVQTGIGGFRFEKSIFKHRATLYLPRIDFNDSTQKFLLNLCAYEGMNIHLKKKLFAYVTIMDDLISSEEDVQLLRKGDEPIITENYLGEDKKIAEVTRCQVSMRTYLILVTSTHYRSDQIPITDHRLPIDYRRLPVTDQIHEWYKAGWRIRLTRFLDKFDHTPWAVITLLVAAFLLVAAIVQVYFAVKRDRHK